MDNRFKERKILMKNWENTNINIGTVKPYQRTYITFKCLESLEDVATITSSCGCSQGHVSGNNVIVSYKPGDVPKHMASSGLDSYNTSKTIRVHYINGETDVLQFVGVVKR